MTVELASTRAVEKPWGRSDLRPWSDAGRANGKIGEIAPNAELSRLRLAKPPPSKSGSLARTCGDGKAARLAFAPQVARKLIAAAKS